MTPPSTQLLRIPSHPRFCLLSHISKPCHLYLQTTAGITSFLSIAPLHTSPSSHWIISIASLLSPGICFHPFFTQQPDVQFTWDANRMSHPTWKSQSSHSLPMVFILFSWMIWPPLASPTFPSFASPSHFQIFQPHSPPFWSSNTPSLFLS